MTYDEAHAEFGRRLMTGDWLEAARWYNEQFAAGLVEMPETEYRDDAPPDVAPTISKWDWLGDNTANDWMYWENVREARNEDK